MIANSEIWNRLELFAAQPVTNYQPFHWKFMKYDRWGIATIIFSLTLCSPLPTLACSCDEPSPQRIMREAQRVFIGKVSSIAPDRNGSDLQHVRFVVGYEWKGDRKSSITIVTRTPGGANCGVSFEVGEEYFVVSTGGDLNLSYTNSCNTTTRLRHIDVSELQQYGEGRIIR
jgi:hypothetical protein